MKNHYIVLADHARLRIFTDRAEPSQTTPALEEVFAMDFPAGHAGYTDNESDMAGRFQSSKHQQAGPGAPGARTGMSIDERLPLRREHERRNLDEVAREIDIFLKLRPEAGWDFAAGPGSHKALLERLSPPVRGRLRRSLAKDLVNQPLAELLERFEPAA